MSTAEMCAAGIACAVFLSAMFVWLVLQLHKKDLIIERQRKENAGIKAFNRRLIAELNKAKGIDQPFVMPNDDDYGPDFDIEKIFAAAEEQTQEEADEEAECEDPEKRCDSGCKAELDAG